jgi:hypothetical protein
MRPSFQVLNSGTHIRAYPVNSDSISPFQSIIFNLPPFRLHDYYSVLKTFCQMEKISRYGYGKGHHRQTNSF